MFFDEAQIVYLEHSLMSSLRPGARTSCALETRVMREDCISANHMARILI